MVRRGFVGLVLSVVLLALAQSSPLGAAPNKLVLAFYYPWYDHNTWNDPAVPDHPPDRYTSTDAKVMARQIEQAKGANVDGFVSAWYGPQTNANQTETNLRTLLALAQPRNFSIGVLFETASPFMHSLDDTQNALRALLNTHAQQAAYLKWNGKPVVFFWAQGRFSRATWQTIRAQVDPDHHSLWIAEGFDMSLLGVFDGGYLYNIAWADNVGATERQWASRVRATGKQWVGTVMPGWDDTRLVERAQRYKRERQGGAWYQSAWAGAASANPDWIVITSWNEFVENTFIEPSASTGAQYLYLTRSLAAQWKAAPPVAVNDTQPVIAAVNPTPKPRPTQVPTPTPAAPPVVERSFIAAECSDNGMALCLMR